MKSLPDSEIKQLATKPGPKQYLAFDELARQIRDNPSSWSPHAGPWPWTALDITRAPNASEMEWAFLKWSQELNDGKHHELEQEQDARLKTRHDDLFVCPVDVEYPGPRRQGSARPL